MTDQEAAPFGASLDELTPIQRVDVMTAVVAVETAYDLVPRGRYRALHDDTLRLSVARILAAAGRTLISYDAGFTSGFDDQVAAQLADQHIGVLPSHEAAVLALVVVHGYALPQADGRLPVDAGWEAALPVNKAELKDLARGIRDGLFESAVHRLQDASILDPVSRSHLRLGPQFLRLTRGQTAIIINNLVRLAQPRGPLARALDRRPERGTDGDH